MDHDTKYADEVILAIESRNIEKNQRKSDDLVYRYYPVMQRSTIRNQRGRNIARHRGITDEEENNVDELEVTINDPDDELQEELNKYKEQPIGFIPETEGRYQQEDDDDDGDVGSHAGGGGNDAGSNERAGGGGGQQQDEDDEYQYQDQDQDQDAVGEDEEA